MQLQFIPLQQNPQLYLNFTQNFIFAIYNLTLKKISEFTIGLSVLLIKI